MWKPENYGKKFYGPSTLRVGLEKSRNLMTIRIAQDLGLNKIVNFSKNLGIYENPEKLLSISLGSAETTLLKLTSAYSAFINQGKVVDPILIDRIQDSEGKTGTTNKNTDTWFIGFTSNLLIGVYVGSDNPTPLGKFETGSKTALPIFKEFIKKIVKKSDARPFKAAEGTVMMVVDPNTGQKAKFTSKNTIIEVYKEQNVIDGKVLYSNTDRLDTNNILKFY